MAEAQRDFKVGDRVEKTGGSYSAKGTIVSSFRTRNGLQRYVFEFDHPGGLLHIFQGGQLRLIPAQTASGTAPDWE